MIELLAERDQLRTQLRNAQRWAALWKQVAMILWLAEAASIRDCREYLGWQLGDPNRSTPSVRRVLIRILNTEVTR